MYCNRDAALYSTSTCSASPAKSVYGLGPTQGPPITYDPASSCQASGGATISAPAYSVQYYSSYTPCSGLSQYVHSPCSQYSTQSSCAGENLSETGYHTMMGAYGGGGNMGPGDQYRLNSNYGVTGGAGCGCGQ